VKPFRGVTRSGKLRGEWAASPHGHPRAKIFDFES
jgi:hypothetical protein